MKALLFSALGIAVLAVAGFSTIKELPIGAYIPQADLKMKDISGKDISLNDVKKSSGLMVMFSCNTCPYVIKNQRRTVEISKYALDKKIGVVLVNSNEAVRKEADSYEAMKRYAKSQGYAWHYVVDQSSIIADAFGAKRTPETYLFNKNGKLVYHGAIDDNPTNEDAVGRRHLKEAIDEMLADKDISVKISRSVGCGIKRF